MKTNRKSYRMIVLVICLLALLFSMLACTGGGDCQDSNGRPVQCMGPTVNESKTVTQEIQGYVDQTQEEFEQQVKDLSQGDISQNYNCQSIFEDCQ